MTNHDVSKNMERDFSSVLTIFLDLGQDSVIRERPLSEQSNQHHHGSKKPGSVLRQGYGTY